MSDCGHEHEDGAYVLGALSPADRIAFERHLPGCPACERSVRQLAGLPGLLARVPVEVLDSSELRTPLPDTLLPALLRRARRTQRRRTLAVVGLAAAALTAVAIGTAVVAHDDGTPSVTPTVGQSTAAPEQFQPVGAQPISGWVSLTPVAWGTRIDLNCTYADPGSGYSEKSWTYTMVVTRSDGSTEQVTSWKAIAGKTFHLSAGTAATLGQIADVTIRGSDGRTVLRLR
jgi:hypothetical protein